MVNKQTYWAIVPAAGVGKRMQADRPKQYLKLNHHTVIEQTLARLLSVESIKTVVVAIAKGDPYWSTLECSKNKRVMTADGGKERSDSVLSALQCIEAQADDDDWVLVHDAARPCVMKEDIEQLMMVLENSDVGGLLGKSSHDTLKKVDAYFGVLETINRSQIWHAFTPQMFRYTALKNALEEAVSKGFSMTDDASAIELQGKKPIMVEGRADNLKITRPEDLALAAFYLEQQQ